MNREVIPKNERGAALLLTIILMLVFSLLTVNLFELLKASTQISGNHRLDLQTTYLADAGIEDAIKELRANPDWGAGFSEKSFAGGTYTVSVVDGESSNPAIHAEKDITSTATLQGFRRTILSHVKIIRVGTVEPPVYAVATSSWKFVPNPPES